MWLPIVLVKISHISTGNGRDMAFYYLLKILANAIIKANVIIVSAHSARKSNLIICNKIISIIHTTSSFGIGGNHILLFFSHFLCLLYKLKLKKSIVLYKFLFVFCYKKIKYTILIYLIFLCSILYLLIHFLLLRCLQYILLHYFLKLSSFLQHPFFRLA